MKKKKAIVIDNIDATRAGLEAHLIREGYEVFNFRLIDEFISSHTPKERNLIKSCAPEPKQDISLVLSKFWNTGGYNGMSILPPIPYSLMRDEEYQKEIEHGLDILIQVKAIVPNASFNVYDIIFGRGDISQNYSHSRESLRKERKPEVERIRNICMQNGMNFIDLGETYTLKKVVLAAIDYKRNH